MTNKNNIMSSSGIVYPKLRVGSPHNYLYATGGIPLKNSDVIGYSPIGNTYEGTLKTSKEDEGKQKLLQTFFREQSKEKAKIDLEKVLAVKDHIYIDGESSFMGDGMSFIVKLNDSFEFIDFVYKSDDMDEEEETLYGDIWEENIINYIKKQSLRWNISTNLKQAEGYKLQHMLQEIFNYHHERGELHHIMDVENGN